MPRAAAVCVWYPAKFDALIVSVKTPLAVLSVLTADWICAVVGTAYCVEAVEVGFARAAWTACDVANVEKRAPVVESIVTEPAVETVPPARKVAKVERSELTRVWKPVIALAPAAASPPIPPTRLRAETMLVT